MHVTVTGVTVAAGVAHSMVDGLGDEAIARARARARARQIMNPDPLSLPKASPEGHRPVIANPVQGLVPKAFGQTTELSLAPIGHERGEMGFGSGGTHTETWNRLPQAVRQRLEISDNDKCLEWWARHDSAVVLTKKALRIATRRTDGRFEVRTIDLNPDSIETYNHDLQPIPASSGSTDHVNYGRSGPPRMIADSAGYLPEYFTKFLGNLPVKAQQFLQMPFKSATSEPCVGFDYELSADTGPRSLTVLCYIANRRRVTFMRAVRQNVNPADPFCAGPSLWHSELTYVTGHTQETSVKFPSREQLGPH